MERKFVKLDNIATQAGEVAGYASVFGGVDSYRDTILRGAYLETIAAAEAAGGLPMLWQHNADQPIGRWMEFAEDERGLKVTGSLTPGHSIARDVQASLAAGHVDGLSIGFDIPDGGWRERTDGVRELIKINLREVSFVTFPADASARGGLKASDLTEREFERLLLRAMRDAGAEFSRSDAVALMRGGFKGLNVTRDADGRSDASADLKAALISATRL